MGECGDDHLPATHRAHDHRRVARPHHPPHHSGELHDPAPRADGHTGGHRAPPRATAPAARRARAPRGSPACRRRVRRDDRRSRPSCCSRPSRWSRASPSPCSVEPRPCGRRCSCSSRSCCCSGTRTPTSSLLGSRPGPPPCSTSRSRRSRPCSPSLPPDRSQVWSTPASPRSPTSLLVLLAVAGPATFVMTSTTPLVSSWYARERLARDPDGDRRDPYWLYALSNFGSLVSLLAYPFLIEPLIGLSAQRVAWTAGFGLLVGFLAVAAPRVQHRDGRPVDDGSRRHRRRSPSIAALRRLRWILLAAIPSGMLAAVTNLDHDRPPSAPLLWVIPLAIYLGTFVVAFSERGRRALPVIIAITPGGPDPAVDPARVRRRLADRAAPADRVRRARDRGHGAPRTTRRRSAAARGPDWLLPDDVGRRRHRRRIRGHRRAARVPGDLGIPDPHRRRGRRARVDAADASGRGPARAIAASSGGWAWRFVPYLLVAVGLIALMRVDGSPRSTPRPAG